VRKRVPGEIGKLQHLSFFVDGAVIQALDEEADRLMAAQPPIRFTRTDVLRIIIHNWINRK
jgi:hypothetical protein